MDIPLQAQAKPSQNITMQQHDATHYYSRNEKEVDTVRQAE
jgi:hypothetical protein